MLFGVVGWNIAETTRMIEVAKKAKVWCEPHFLSYGGQFDHLVTDEGFSLHHGTPADTPQKIEHLWAVDRGEKIATPYTKEEISQRVAFEVSLAKKLGASAMVMGSVLTFSISARVVGVPLINVVPFALTRPYLEAGLPALPGRSRIVNTLTAFLALRVPVYMRPFNTVAKAYGVPTFRTALDVWSGDINCVSEHHLLMADIALPDNWRACGPIFANLPGQIPDVVQQWIAGASCPTVYFAMGSSANRDVLELALSAFEGMAVRVVAPISAHLRLSTAIPDNVLVTDWLPALDVNRLVDCAVIHGGAGTVQTAIHAGIPFVGIGMQPEQSINIESVVRWGAAIRLPRRRLTPTKVRSAVMELLSNDSFAKRAKELAGEGADGVGAQQVADVVKKALS